MGPWRNLRKGQEECSGLWELGTDVELESKLRWDVDSGFHPLRGAALQCVLEPRQLCKRLETL